MFTSINLNAARLFRPLTFASRAQQSPPCRCFHLELDDDQRSALRIAMNPICRPKPAATGKAARAIGLAKLALRGVAAILSNSCIKAICLRDSDCAHPFSSNRARKEILRRYKLKKDACPDTEKARQVFGFIPQKLIGSLKGSTELNLGSLIQLRVSTGLCNQKVYEPHDQTTCPSFDGHFIPTNIMPTEKEIICMSRLLTSTYQGCLDLRTDSCDNTTESCDRFAICQCLMDQMRCRLRNI